MSQLIPILTEFMEVVAPFDRTLTHIHVARNKAGTVIVAAPTEGGFVEISAEILAEVPELEGVACLGSLPVLRTICGSKFLPQCAVELTFDRSSREDIRALKTIRFAGKKVDLLYQATDPFIGQMLRPNRLKQTDWPVEIILNTPIIKEFTDLHRIHAANRSTDPDSKLFHLVLGEGRATIEMGRTHRVRLIIAEDIDLTYQFDAYYLIDPFAVLMKLGEPGPFACSLCDKAMRLQWTTESAIYTAVCVRSLRMSA